MTGKNFTLLKSFCEFKNRKNPFIFQTHTTQQAVNLSISSLSNDVSISLDVQPWESATSVEHGFSIYHQEYKPKPSRNNIALDKNKPKRIFKKQLNDKFKTNPRQFSKNFVIGLNFFFHHPKGLIQCSRLFEVSTPVFFPFMKYTCA